jgi:HAD superfamily hydrolase (TIGR01509 family)
MKIKAILFDLDGTLRDSTEPLFVAIEAALSRYLEAVPTRDELRPYMHYHEIVRQKFANDADAEEFNDVFRKEYESKRGKVRLHDHAAKVVNDLHAQGTKLAIVSMATTSEKFLTEQKLRHLFDAIVTPNDVTRFKPHPEPVQVALDRLKVAAADAVMVGDTGADIQAAHAAGLGAAIGLTHGMATREILQEVGADHIIDSLAELPAVLERLERQ